MGNRENHFIHQLETTIAGQYRRYRVGVDRIVRIDRNFIYEAKELIYSVIYEDGTIVDVTGSEMIVEYRKIVSHESI